MPRPSKPSRLPLDSLQLPHLETFLRAAELCNFTATAKALNVTQAAVSKRIQALEKALDTSLFRREGGRLLLTDAGQRLHDYTQRILALHDEARREIAGVRTALTGDLELGASTIPGEHLLPALLPAFRQRYPGIQVKVAISDSGKVLRQVERGQVGLGLVGLKNDSPHLEFRPWGADRMVLVVPRDHAWAKRKHVTLAKLREQPLILREEGSGLRHCFEKGVREANLAMTDFQVAFELGSNESIKEAVVQGLGIAVISWYAVHKDLDSGLLHALRVTDLHCDRPIYVVWDRRRVLPAPARLFRFFLESHSPGDAAP